MMRRVFPHPLVSLGILVMWLLLNQSVSTGHILLGCLFGITGAWVLTTLELPPVRIRRPQTIIKLAFIVLTDIIRSNIAVGRIILGKRPEKGQSGLVHIPLRMHNPYGLAMLGIIITSTPGTLWVKYDSMRSVLTIHVLDLVDESVWQSTIRDRYESRLMEIFQ